MSYFPFFVDLKGKNGLIAGGGTVALHKILRLLPYGSNLTVVSEKFNNEITRNFSSSDSVQLIERKFADDDIKDKYFVIAATDDSALNAHIYDICTEERILVNVVDDRQRCGFMFPSLVKKGNLSVGISTEGASPRIASVYRQKLEREIPDEIEPILTYLDSIRPAVKNAVDDEKTRAGIFTQIADFCLDNLTVPDEEWLESILQRYRKQV